MTLREDGTRCVGHGVCESIHPDVFEVNDDGYVDIDPDTAATADEAAVRQAVTSCPSAALRLDD